MKNHNQLIPVIILILIAAIAIFYFYGGRKAPLSNTPQPPASGTVPADWKIYTDPVAGITFAYPEMLGTKYLSTVDWPPTMEVSNESFTCTQAGKEIERAGITERKVINGQTYCVTKVSEGAAGSTYTMYAYKRAVPGGTQIYTFSLKFVQCENYPELQASECTTERNSFDIDAAIDKIIETSRSIN